MRFQIAYMNDAGRRRENQDSLYYATAEIAGKCLVCAAVCDGMGGLERGSYASAVLAGAVDRWFTETFSENGVNWRNLKTSLGLLAGETSRKLTEKGDELHCRMGTTCVLLLAAGRHFQIMNIGDSRAYRIRNGRIRQLTHDQSLSAAIKGQKKASGISREEKPESSVLLQCVGASCVPDPEFAAGRIRDGDLFLLCSDGFWRMQEDGDLLLGLAGAAGEEDKMQRALRHLAAGAYRKGETDNMTALTVYAGKEQHALWTAGRQRQTSRPVR